MAKRIADKELTDRNWDQEEDGEEAGTFSVASEDVLKNRAIKKAKRRNVGAENENSGAFKGFKGFSLITSQSGGSMTTAFSGFGNGAGFKTITNGSGLTPSPGGFSSPATASSTSPGLTFNGPASTQQASAVVTAKQTNGSAPSPSPSPGCGSKEYSRQLTALNCSVRDWITKHVNGNPLCDLNPIFRDYEQHLASIERKYGAAAAAGEPPQQQQQAGLPTASTTSGAAARSFTGGSAVATATAPKPFPSFNADKDTPAAARDKMPAGVTFNFGQKVDGGFLGSLGGPPPSFSFSPKPSTGQGSPFGSPAVSAVPFSFKAEAVVQPTDETGEESEEPPKPEVREIKEKDAFYSKKCKLFYKKESEFKEKGVGTLHLKPTAEGKTQMIVRADTNLGNILLNILLQASMPCSRMGKNNVMVVCVPNPPIDDKSPTSPIPLLIRVKTPDDAEELHNILEEKKA